MHGGTRRALPARAGRPGSCLPADSLRLAIRTRMSGGRECPAMGAGCCGLVHAGCTAEPAVRFRRAPACRFFAAPRPAEPCPMFGLGAAGR
jgi:hypothetical protein